MKKLIFTLVISLYALNAKCGDLTILLTQPPPFKVTVSSFWKVSLKNSGPSREFHLRLEGSATKIGEMTPYISATTNNFSLYIPNNGGLTPVPSNLLVEVDLTGSTTEIMTTGSLPAGHYKICIKVVDRDNDSNSTTECLDGLDGTDNYSIENFSLIKITSPMDESEVESIYPVFTWTPSVVSPGVNYTLNIYEILSTQTPYSAVVSNREFFQYTKIPGTIFRYPEISRKFSGGRKYAIQIKAYINDFFITQSEIISFTYKNLITSEPDYLYKKNIGYRNYGDEIPNGASSPILHGKRSTNYSLNSSLDYQLSDTAGPYSNLEKDFARISLIPKINFNDIPFDLNLFYPTDNNSSKQPMYNASLILNQDSLNSILAYSVESRMNARSGEIEKEISVKGESYRESIEKKERKRLIDELPNRLKTFSDFQNLGVGFNLYPQYSNYTVSGVQIKGLNLEYNPGNFYLALAGPLNNKAIDNVSFRRIMVTGRMGYGKKDNSHLFLTMMYAKDVESSIEPIINSTQILTPQENILAGLEGNLNLFNNKLKLEGEIAGSGITNDFQAPKIDVESLNLSPIKKSAYDLIDIFIRVNSSTSANYFYKIKATYEEFLPATKFSAEVERVQPGYVSLGSPDKSNDQFVLKFSAESKFFNNQLSAKTLLKRIEDNLMGGIYKAFTTEQWFLTLLLNLRFRNYPAITVNYSPQILNNDAADSVTKLKNFNNNLNITAGYPFRISGAVNNLLLTFYLNNSNTFEDKYNNSQWGINFINSVYFKSPLWITGSLGYSDSKAISNSVSYYDYNNYSAEFNLGYTFSEYVQNYAGLSYAYSPDRNKVLTFYINYILKIFKNININMRLEDNVIKNKDGNGWQSNYLDVIFKGQVTWDLN